MVNGVDAAQQVGEKVPVAGVALVEVDPRAEVRRASVPVYRLSQRVQDEDVVSELE